METIRELFDLSGKAVVVTGAGSLVLVDGGCSLT
jgi:hypothetical protein